MSLFTNSIIIKQPKGHENYIELTMLSTPDKNNR